jgi:hypothetical protein
MWSLAFLLFAEGANNLARVDLVLAGVRRTLAATLAQVAGIAGLAEAVGARAAGAATRPV